MTPIPNTSLIESFFTNKELELLVLKWAIDATDYSFFVHGKWADIPIEENAQQLHQQLQGIKEQLDLKKWMFFWAEVCQVDREKRLEFVERMHEKVHNRDAFYEYLFYTISQLDHAEKAIVVAKILGHFIRKNISQYEFYALSKVVKQAHLDELKYFIFTEAKHHLSKDELEEWKELDTTMKGAILEERLIALGLRKGVRQLTPIGNLVVEVILDRKNYFKN